MKTYKEMTEEERQEWFDRSIQFVLHPRDAEASYCGESHERGN